MIDQIDQDIKKALKGGDQPTASALRYLKSVFLNNRIAIGHELNQEEIVRIIRKEVKARIEARDIYKNNGRQELADKEEFERQLYVGYIPADLTVSELSKLIEQVAGKTAAADFGKLMPEVMKSVAGRADGKIVAESVKSYIERQKA